MDNKLFVRLVELNIELAEYFDRFLVELATVLEQVEPFMPAINMKKLLFDLDKIARQYNGYGLPLGEGDTMAILDDIVFEWMGEVEALTKKPSSAQILEMTDRVFKAAGKDKYLPVLLGGDAKELITAVETWLDALRADLSQEWV